MKSIAAAEKLETGFVSFENQVSPSFYTTRLITATVAFVPPGTTPEDIIPVLKDRAKVKQVHLLFLKDFPSIRSGKFRVILLPNGDVSPAESLPACLTLHGRCASLSYAGRIPRCPYCDSAEHLGSDCPHKGKKKCFICDEFGHL